MPRARSQAERDSVTVEMVFAALTGAILAVLGFIVTALPVLVGRAHGAAREGWLTAAVVVYSRIRSYFDASLTMRPRSCALETLPGASPEEST